MILSNADLLLYWFIYTIMCLPFTGLMVAILPLRFRYRPLIPFIFFFVLSSAVIAFGVLISLVLVLFLHFQKPAKKEKQFFTLVDYPDYQQSPISENIEYGENSGFKIVTDKNSSKILRQKMLVAVNQLGTNNANKINSIALSDDLDEIRLYAHSLIEKQERRFSNLLKNFSEQLAKAKDKKRIAYCKKQLAEILWEQVYKYLITNESLNVTLHKIKNYATDALVDLPGDPELPLLLAKVALRLADLDAAKQWLEVATVNQAPEYKIMSNLAEIEYIQQNYANVIAIFRSFNCDGIIGLQPIRAFWLQHD